MGHAVLSNPTDSTPILPRSKWWWLALALLLILAGWFYLRGYNVSLPYFDHTDEPHHLLAAQHIIDDGSARAVFHEGYPPGISRLNYLFLKHVKPPEAHHGTVLPALRLTTISVWMVLVAVIALFGSQFGHPLTGLIAAAVWIVNPWVVQRAHFVLPDGYLTLFTLLSIWMALIGTLNGRRSYSTAAVYFIMLAIVFKTQAVFVAPIIVLMPLVNMWRRTDRRVDTLHQTFWNCVRIAIFLFWLLLLYPIPDIDNIPHFAVETSDFGLPSLLVLLANLKQVLLSFQSEGIWYIIAIGILLLTAYRRRVYPIGIITLCLAALVYLLGMSLFGVQGLRQFFILGALLALLYAFGLTGLLLAAQDALTRMTQIRLPREVLNLLIPASLALYLAVSLLPAYRKSDALVHDFTLPDRRVDLMQYMDTSVFPGKYISNYENHKTFNRAWGGYDGVHDYPWHQEYALLSHKPIEEWRALGAEYAIMPQWRILKYPDIYYPAETVLLKTYPVDSRFRGPNMVVLRLYPLQNLHDGQLGSIRLLGYDINTAQVQAGEDIVLRHYWQADKPTDSIHHVYNHLLDESGEIVMQTDYIPLWDARRPTTTWDDPEEIMLGREFILSLPTTLPQGSYQVISGLYDPVTWKRLATADGADRLIIAEVAVAQSGP